MCETTFSTRSNQVENRNRMVDETLDDSLRLATTNIDKHRNDSVREASTTGIPLIEICNKLLFAIV